jgi:hypothetical protein
MAELTANDRLTFWGPSKLIELLEHGNAILPAPPENQSPQYTATKRILLYAYYGRFWITILSNKVFPTHYRVASATGDPIPNASFRLIAELDEVKNLDYLADQLAPTFPTRISVALDAVAEVQEADEWDDYRPVGAKFFVGREDVSQKLYSFLQTPRASQGTRRIFFIESKSGWGKSSLVANIRARSRNTRNKGWLYVLGVDSRSANTGAFVGLAFAKLVNNAARSGFIPEHFSNANVASSYDILASDEVARLLAWLRTNKKVLVLIFDQFEDMFRKADLFPAFHKFMLDTNAELGNLIVGFSWKSEINVPIDNPAYGLWQQTRDQATAFGLDEFLGAETDKVIKQLEEASKQQLPVDLRRKLRESSQGFPWLTKRLAIHCYHQIIQGTSPEELLDQNLNVDVLMREDMESLSPDEARALKHIAKRGYEGDPFDVAEIDDKVSGQDIHSLLNKRLIVRSGAKYNVYWDIFRDFLVEDRIPTILESFLLRQFPAPCERTLELLLPLRSATLSQILAASLGLTEGTALNRLRELRYLGAITKEGDHYTVQKHLTSMEDFKASMRERLQRHVVMRALMRNDKDSISHEDVVDALISSYKGYGFGTKTWNTYASYFVSWCRYVGVEFGRKLRLQAKRTGGPAAFIPQWRPERDCETFFAFRMSLEIDRVKQIEKSLYDLRSLGLIEYAGNRAVVTRTGFSLLKMNDEAVRLEIARLAVGFPKLAKAHEAYSQSGGADEQFEANVHPALVSIPSASYRKVALYLLKAWGRFLSDELATSDH